VPSARRLESELETATRELVQLQAAFERENAALSALEFADVSSKKERRSALARGRAIGCRGGARRTELEGTVPASPGSRRACAERRPSSSARLRLCAEQARRAAPGAVNARSWLKQSAEISS